MDFHWLTFVHLGILSVALVLATWIRVRVPLMRLLAGKRAFASPGRLWLPGEPEEPGKK